MWYQRSAEEVEKALGTSGERGLTPWEHDHRLEENGPNTLKKEKKQAKTVIFLRQFADFMVIVLMAAAVVSAFLGETADALMIVAIIVLNSVLGFVQEYKAERSLEALKKITEDEARVIIGGRLAVKKAAELVVGDVVLLEAGAKVPADLRLVESRRLTVDESILTGESRDVAKTAEPLKGEDLALGERTNMAFSGTVVTGGRGRGVVTAAGMDTELGKIASLLESGERELTPLQKQLKQLGKALIAVCSLVCVVVALAGFLLGGDVYTMILTGVSLGVASIPEGLPIVVTVCLALGVRRLARVSAVVRRLPSVETLGCVTCICADKTGTLTKNRMETKKFYADGRWHDVPSFADTAAAADTCFIIAGCNSLYKEGNGWYGDPTERALMEAAAKCGAPDGDIVREDEIAFDSDRKLMSVLCRRDGALVSLVKGAPDRVLLRCARIRENGVDLPLTERERERITAAAAEASRGGFRVLGLALREDAASPRQMETELTFVSLAAISDPLREDAAASLAAAAGAGVRSIMITGDQRGTAFAVGRELGIAAAEEDVLTAADLAALSDGDLAAKLKKTSVIAGVSPADKMRVVSVLRRNGEVCAMTGDGVNDAPALREADIGIAMGKKGTDVTKAAADFILADDNFATIVEAIRQGRGIYDNIRRSIRYLLSSNLGEILVMLFSVLLCFPLPLLPLQILWINLVTDGLPALALAMEPPEDGLMRRPPRPPRSKFLDPAFAGGILLRGSVIGVLCFAAFCAGILLDSDIDAARTMAFNALVISQLLYVFDCRGGEGRFGGGRFFSNRFLWSVILVSLALQGAVLYSPLISPFFVAVPLSPRDLLLTVAISVLPSLFSALRAVFSKRK